MRLLRTVLAFMLLAAGLFAYHLPPSSWQRHAGSSECIDEHFGDFLSFREARLKLPESYEPFCLPLTETAMLTRCYQEQFPAGKALPAYRLVLSREFDLDGDGVPENYKLRNGKITAQIGSQIIWQSPPDWWVDYFFLGDANNDGLSELNLLLWKEGSFGPHRPFWVEEDDSSIKNHLFIFKLKEGKIKPVWQSSNLDHPNYWAALTDFNGDGEKELLVLEGSYIDPRQRKVTLWKWNGWGFSRY
ncbi:MAG: hypothetical protein GX767_07070 [Firmicutes bacterium]|nr:hypothetical protein [Bacillota bacterium]